MLGLLTPFVQLLQCLFLKLSCPPGDTVFPFPPAGLWNRHHLWRVQNLFQNRILFIYVFNLKHLSFKTRLACFVQLGVNRHIVVCTFGENNCVLCICNWPEVKIHVPQLMSTNNSSLIL